VCRSRFTGFFGQNGLGQVRFKYYGGVLKARRMTKGRATGRILEKEALIKLGLWFTVVVNF